MKTLERIALKLRHYHSALGMKGVVLFLYSKATGSKPVVKVRLPECEHPVNLRIGTTDISTYKQVLVEKHYEFDLPEEAELIIDAGANIGLAAVYFANRYPDATIVSIEPEDSNFEMLRKNAAPYPNIVPKKAALWRTNEALFLFDHGHGNHGFQIGDEDGRDGGMGSVPGLTVDAIVDEHGKDRVDLLKIDIEGAEREVMEASEPWIGRVDVLMIELHDDIKPGCSKAFYEATRSFSNDVIKGETIMKHSVSMG